MESSDKWSALETFLSYIKMVKKRRQMGIVDAVATGRQPRLQRRISFIVANRDAKL